MNISKKKISIFTVIILAVFSLVCCLSINAYSSEELSAADSLADKGFIVNHSDNPSNYNLSNSVLRQEIAAIVYEIAGLQKKSTCENRFSDVSASVPNSWSCLVVEALYDANFLAKNDKFNPESKITKAEALGMLVSAAYSDEYSYDSSLATSWQEQLVSFAVKKGISESFSDYDSMGKRGWIFVIADKILKNQGQVLKQTDFIDDDYVKTSSKTTIVFASSMNKDSVEQNFKIYPELETKLTWISDKELEVSIEEKPEEDVDVIVNILDSALDLDGNKIEKTITKQFKTSGVARLDFISPEGELTDLDKNITVRFSKPMIALTALDNQGFCPITITPSLSGKCVWITTTTFQFRPDRGFPIGASYDVKVDSGLETIAGDKTISGANIKITTPKFKVLSGDYSGYIDKPLVISFNGEVSLDNFIKNFSLSGFKNTDLDIDYLKIPSSIEGEYDVRKTSVSIFPKNGDWGYSKNYNYTLSSGLKSARGNITIGQDKRYSFSTESLLTSYSPFVYRDSEATENLDHISNFKNSENKSIITKSSPKILLNFYEEVALDKSYFSLGGYSFTLKHPKKTEYIDGESVVKEDKKSIVLEINGDLSSDLNLKFYASKINQNTSDISLNFKTKSDNKVLDYKFINYNKSCVDFKYDMGYSFDTSKFDFGDDRKAVSYVYKLQSYSRDDDCKYIPGVNRYIVNTRLNPESNYSLSIKKDLLDADNYPLSEEYNTSFVTGKALNQDKRVSLLDFRDLILVPTDVNPLGVAVETVNLDKVNVEVCEGDFDITNPDYIGNSNCKTREIAVNDLKFKTNFSVLDLEEIFGQTFSKSLITLKVDKLDIDKTDSEKKTSSYYYNYGRKSHYLITDKSLVLKASKQGLLWLSDFKTGENLTDSISKISLYKKEGKYDSYGKYITTNTYKNDVSFNSLGEGLYSLNSDLRGLLLVTLKSGEQILLDSQDYYPDTLDSKVYITTDRPIYKPGDTVRIKGVGRDETATGYNIKSGIYKLDIRDSRYKNIVSKDLTFSSNGTVTYEFKLDENASLGNYNINLGSGSIGFAVEEYEKPDFKVDSSSTKDSYLYSQSPKVSVGAEYYIGSALAFANGNYSVIASDYNFDGGKTTGYIWGENTYYWGWRYYDSFRQEETHVGSGEFVLDRLGKSSFLIDTTSTTKDKVYTVSSTVTDPNTKKSISDSTSFKVLNSDVFVGLKTNSYYYNYGGTAKFEFVTVDKEGNKLANKAIKFRAYKINYNYNKTNYSYETDEKLLFEKSLTTSSSGLANLDYKIGDYGEYRFEVLTSDEKYKTVKTMYVSGYNLLRPTEEQHDISIVSSSTEYKAGEKAEFVIQSPVVGVKALVTVEKLDKVLYRKIIDIDSNSQKFTLDIDKTYLPNFDLKAFIIKDVKNSSKALDELKDLRIEMLDLETDLRGEDEVFPIPLYIAYDIVNTKGFVPFYDNQDYDKELLNKLAELRAKEQKLMQEILPSYYSGSTVVKVSLDSVKLNSKVKTDKDNYLPGDGSRIELTILDSNGNPVSGEVMISVVDESLLALKFNNLDIVDFFYSNTSNYIRTIFNMQNLIKRFEFKDSEDLDEEVNGADDGGYAMDTMANSVESEEGAVMAKSLSFAQVDEQGGAAASMDNNSNSTKLRTEFKDSAYYNGVVNLVNGKATVTIPKLPDNLTTWVITGYTITKDTKLGSFESKFKVKKDLNLLPSIPRVFVSGDQMEITATVINNTSKNLDITSSLEITNASIISKPSVVTVEANSQKLLTWKVSVDPMNASTSWDNFSSDILLKVNSGNLVDSLSLKRKILPYSTPEYSFTNGSTYDLSYEKKIALPDYVDKTMGKLDITLGSTILTNLLDSVENLARMPFNNFYSTVSALKKGAILKSLYEQAGELDRFKQITVIDYNLDEHKLEDIINARIKDIKNYQNSDGGMMTYEDCVPNSWMRSCSNFDLTGDFLSMARELKEAGYTVDASLVNKALDYYKKELENKIRDYESNPNNGKYRSVEPFYKIIGYGSAFINKYLLSDRFSLDYSFDNVSKLKIMLLLQTTSPNSSDLSGEVSNIRNSVLIEARGSLVPSGNWGADNTISTALALRVFIKDLEGEKLIIENLARWLMAQKRENGNFGNGYDSSEVIKTITDYISYTKELENTDFDAVGFLNSKEIIKASFDSTNKFDLVQDSFSLKDYLNFGEDNSLGFEKTGSGKLYYDVGLRYFLPIDKIAPREEGIIVNRSYYNYDDYKDAYKNECYYWYCTKVQTKSLSSVDFGYKGDLLVGEIEIIVPSERNNVVVNNFIPAGAEIVNINLDTTSDEIKEITSSKREVQTFVDYAEYEDDVAVSYVSEPTDSFYYEGGSSFNHIEVKDDRLELFADHLYKGTYRYTYVIFLNHSGTYHHRPAVAYELKKPEIWGRTRGGFFTIK